ncbi:hypothetical protein DUNSADRAFT_3680, partial [Dunaliella salina]
MLLPACAQDPGMVPFSLKFRFLYAYHSLSQSLLAWVSASCPPPPLPVCRTLNSRPLRLPVHVYHQLSPSACFFASCGQSAVTDKSYDTVVHDCAQDPGSWPSQSHCMTLDQGPLGGSLGRNPPPSPSRRNPFGKGLSNIFESSTDDELPDFLSQPRAGGRPAPVRQPARQPAAATAVPSAPSPAQAPAPAAPAQTIPAPAQKIPPAAPAPAAPASVAHVPAAPAAQAVAQPFSPPVPDIPAAHETQHMPDSGYVPPPPMLQQSQQQLLQQQQQQQPQQQNQGV